MKKILTLIASALLFVASASAQFDDGKKVKFGFDLGVGYANQWGSAHDAYAQGGIFSFLFGIDMDIKLPGKQFLEVGIDFTRKGTRFEGTEWLAAGGPWGLYDNDKTTANLYYLQVPILYGIDLPIESEIAWRFMVGPYFGIGATGDRRTELNNKIWDSEVMKALREPSAIASFSTDYQYGYKRFDLGARVQTGIQVRRVSYMIAYEIGFLNILQDKDHKDLKARNNGIMAIASFRF